MFFVHKKVLGDMALHVLLFEPGLPDGLFSNQKSQCGYILEGLGMENVVIFYVHL
jgi:hypothetical protein